MDFSIRRIESGAVRGPGPSRRRKDGEGGAAFDLELGGPPREPEDEDERERADDTPVSAPGEDEAGGRLDVTA